MTYYAITGIGWGRGETPEAAVEEYYRAQKRSWPHLTLSQLDEDFWGFVWNAPEGATGFYAESDLHWRMEDGSVEDSDEAQRVAEIGNVPARWRLQTASD